MVAVEALSHRLDVVASSSMTADCLAPSSTPERAAAGRSTTASGSCSPVASPAATAELLTQSTRKTASVLKRRAQAGHALQSGDCSNYEEGHLAKRARVEQDHQHPAATPATAGAATGSQASGQAPAATSCQIPDKQLDAVLPLPLQQQQEQQQQEQQEQQGQGRQEGLRQGVVSSGGSDKSGQQLVFSPPLHVYARSQAALPAPHHAGGAGLGASTVPTVAAAAFDKAAEAASAETRGQIEAAAAETRGQTEAAAAETRGQEEGGVVEECLDGHGCPTWSREAPVERLEPATAAVAAVAERTHHAHHPPPPEVPEAAESEVDADEGVEIDFDPLLFIRSLPPLEQCVCEPRAVLLPDKAGQSGRKKTLVLDLDETLVHSSVEALDPGAPPPDFTLHVAIGNIRHTIHVRRRPHLHEFMTAAAALFEVVVFTASQKPYAEQLLNVIDPDRKLIAHRVFRDSCVVVDGNYLKDLTILGRDMATTFIVDNSPHAFGFQPDNGIPIESWFDDASDVELRKLLPFLRRLASEEVDDVRPLIAARYRLKELIARLPMLV